MEQVKIQKRLIPYVINAIRNGEELHFTAGDQTRQYIHVNEVPRMLALAFEKNLPSGLYNIQGKGNRKSSKRLLPRFIMLWGRKYQKAASEVSSVPMWV